VQKKYNFKMLYQDDGAVRLKFSQRGSMVIVEDGADEIMQTFMSGQEQAYEGFLLVGDEGENVVSVEETPMQTGNNNSEGI
jgi:hypothetical protein